MPQEELRKIVLPRISIECGHERTRALNFTFDSLAAISSIFKLSIDINPHALTNAPTVEQGILEAMSLKEQVQKSLLRDS